MRLVFCTGSRLTVGVEDPGKFFIVKLYLGSPGNVAKRLPKSTYSFAQILDYTYIHTYIRLLTTSPKGLFSANYKEKDKNKNIYKLFKVTIANH